MEYIEYLISVPIVGVLMVFAVLALLWGVLSISKVILYDLPRRRKGQSDKASAQEKQPAAVAAPVTAAPVAPVTDDAAIVAAITAAIAAMRADEGCPNGFRVVSFRRADNARAWNRK